MTITAQYQKHVAELPFGEYPAHLVSIDEIESHVPAKEGENPDPVCWQWTFLVATGEHKGKIIKGISSRTYSPRSKSYEWAIALDHPARGADFADTNVLGHPCRLQVGVDEREDGSTWNRVLKVLPPNKGQKALDMTPRPVADF